MKEDKAKMDIKGKNILLKVRNKETGEDGWINATEFVETIFRFHTNEVLIPLFEEYDKRRIKRFKGIKNEL